MGRLACGTGLAALCDVNKRMDCSSERIDEKRAARNRQTGENMRTLAQNIFKHEILIKDEIFQLGFRFTLNPFSVRRAYVNGWAAGCYTVVMYGVSHAASSTSTLYADEALVTLTCSSTQHERPTWTRLFGYTFDVGGRQLPGSSTVQAAHHNTSIITRTTHVRQTLSHSAILQAGWSGWAFVWCEDFRHLTTPNMVRWRQRRGIVPASTLELTISLEKMFSNLYTIWNLQFYFNSNCFLKNVLESSSSISNLLDISLSAFKKIK